MVTKIQRDPKVTGYWKLTIPAGIDSYWGPQPDEYEWVEFGLDDEFMESWPPPSDDDEGLLDELDSDDLEDRGRVTW